MTPDFEMHPHPAEVAPVNPNTCQSIALAFAQLCAAVAVIGLMVWGAVSLARADHPAEHHNIHLVFYSDWMRLDTASSCCNSQDCFPTIMQQDDKGRWWALRQSAALLLERDVAAGNNPLIPPLDDPVSWIAVPENLLEHNAQRVDLGVRHPRDPRDSPDGRSHACVSGDTVYCAVVGNGM